MAQNAISHELKFKISWRTCPQIFQHKLHFYFQKLYESNSVPKTCQELAIKSCLTSFNFAHMPLTQSLLPKGMLIIISMHLFVITFHLGTCKLCACLCVFAFACVHMYLCCSKLHIANLLDTPTGPAECPHNWSGQT